MSRTGSGLALLMATLCLTSLVDWSAEHYSSSSSSGTGPGYVRRHSGSGRRGRNRRSDRPNIVLILTDDQDIELGSMNYMPKTARAMRDAGATFTNAFVTTPMCCPSRSSMLTGLYVHNHFVYTNNDNCSSPQWRQTHETRTFGTYLHDAGYRTAYFGKYLNEYSGEYVPPGWTEWQGLIRNSRYYNYTLNHNGQRFKHEDRYHLDYLTDLIANESVRFIRQSRRSDPRSPVAMVLSVPAPHGPEDAAPQYQDLFFDVKSHRTPSWNFAPNPDKQWLLQYAGKMTPVQIAFTDLLHTKRLQTLQSVDDAVEKLCRELEAMGELENTYVIFTSDHGYHLGQYGLVKGKAMPYEFDIRVPFLVRGPKIPAGIRMPNIALNVDIAPTILDIAGVPIPDHMDGNSIMKLFDGHYDSYGSPGVRRRRVWRDTFLVERGKLTTRKLKVQQELEAQVNRLVLTKDQRLEDECLKPEYQAPCKPGQWECRRNENNRLRIYKCRGASEMVNASVESAVGRCSCSPIMQGDRPVDVLEQRRQLDFLQLHLNKPSNLEDPRFIPRRYRRDATMQPRDNATAAETGNPILTSDDDNDDYFEGTIATSPFPGIDWTPIEESGGEVAIPCRLLSNGTVQCERYVYTSVDGWRTQRDKIERVMHDYRRRIHQLKLVRQHLAESRPLSPRHLIDADAESVSMTTTASSLPTSLSVGVVQSDAASTEPSTTSTHASTSATTTTTQHSSRDDVTDSVVDDKQETKETEECVCDYDQTYEPSKSAIFWAGFRPQLPNKVSEILSKCYSESRRPSGNRIRQIANSYQREERRQRKLERKQRRNTKRRNQRQPVASADCDEFDGSCERSHRSFPQVARGQTRLNRFDGPVRYGARKDPMCNVVGIECSRMDNEHWKVPPYWTHGPFCMCGNSNNNTYWCLRTVNDTHNILYCEFITGFISFYDIAKDPYQLRNAVHDLSFGVLHQLHDTLELMKGCKGARKCDLLSRTPEERQSWKQQRHAAARVNSDRAQHSRPRSSLIYS